ncbi:MAG TPA: dihydrofolate reductase family protein [Thermoanaerobaculia bacterium]|jgi:dihydrofolate reductase
MKATVFVGMSVDGFIARRDGRFDFLPDEPEPHGYEEFMASVDTIVMGRNTFELVMSFGSWPYPKTKRVVVLTSRPVELPAKQNVVHLSGDPRDIVATLEAMGAKHLYVDGGDTVQRFLRAGQIDRLILTRVPVLIGEGISIFGALPHDVKLRHVGTRTYPSGLVQSEYEVVR